MPTIFIDGREGTTGLQIDQRLANRKDVTLITIDPELRKDPAARKDCLNKADFVFLCLPDAAAREAVAMIENPNVRIIDPSTAHRTTAGWDYGFPELGAEQRAAIAVSHRVANPGCYATGMISLVYPLVKAGILPKDYPMVVHALSGYTGGGKKTIAGYEDPNRDVELDSPRLYGLTLAHKHIPEMVAVCGLERKPIFNPIICDFPQGMLVNVPLFPGLLNGVHTTATIREALADHYAGQKFVTVAEGMPESGFLGSNNQADTNNLKLYVGGNDEQVVLCAQLDNLGKGASGAAIQNLNIMMGIDEGFGL